jgi:hypothetical protein
LPGKRAARDMRAIVSSSDSAPVQVTSPLARTFIFIQIMTNLFLFYFSAESFMIKMLIT